MKDKPAAAKKTEKPKENPKDAKKAKGDKKEEPAEPPMADKDKLQKVGHIMSVRDFKGRTLHVHAYMYVTFEIRCNLQGGAEKPEIETNFQEDRAHSGEMKYR